MVVFVIFVKGFIYRVKGLLFYIKNFTIYRNNLKNRFLARAALNLYSEQATIAGGKARVRIEIQKRKPTRSKTDSLGCFGIISHPKPASKKARGGGEIEDGDETQRPDVHEDGVRGEVFEEKPSAKIHEVASWIEIRCVLEPNGHVFDGGRKSREEDSRRQKDKRA